MDYFRPRNGIVTFRDDSDLDCEILSESSCVVVVQSLQIFPAIDLLHDAPDFET